jgi:hypothetical protein
MPIVIACPTCKARLKIPESKAGTRISCPKCQAAMSIPRVSAAPAAGNSPAFAADNPFAFDPPAGSNVPPGAGNAAASYPQAPAVAPPAPSLAPLPDFYAGPETSARKPRRGVSIYTLLGILLGLGALPLAMEVHQPLLGVGLSGLGVILGLVGIMVAIARRGSALALALLTTAMCGSALYTAILIADGPRGILRSINKIINKPDEPKQEEPAA